MTDASIPKSKDPRRGERLEEDRPTVDQPTDESDPELTAGDTFEPGDGTAANPNRPT